MADLKQLAEELVNLTVKEVNELAGILKDEYGIEPAAAAVAVAGPAVSGGDEDVVVEQTEFDVILKAAGQSNWQLLNSLKNLPALA
jgi:large subunit ribosomal protein L7/L12